MDTNTPLIRIGLCGGIASGKSEIAHIFETCYIPVINYDQLSHQLTAPTSEGGRYLSSIAQRIMSANDGEVIDNKELVNNNGMVDDIEVVDDTEVVDNSAVNSIKNEHISKCSDTNQTTYSSNLFHSFDRRRLALALTDNPQFQYEIEYFLHPRIWELALEEERNLFYSFCHDRIPRYYEKSATTFCDNKPFLIVHEVPLLIEAQWEKRFDVIISTSLRRETQMNRLVKYRQYKKEDAYRLIDNQVSQCERVQYADFIINTEGLREEVRASAHRLVELIIAQACHL